MLLIPAYREAGLPELSSYRHRLISIREREGGSRLDSTTNLGRSLNNRSNFSSSWDKKCSSVNTEWIL